MAALTSDTPNSYVRDFPVHLLNKATRDPENRVRLQFFKDAGLKVVSLCSGIDAVGEALRLLQLAMQESAGHADEDTDVDWWVVKGSWCDSGSAQQAFLLARAGQMQSHLRPCLFQSVEDMVPHGVREELGMLTPPACGNREQKAAAVNWYQKVGQALTEKGPLAFPKEHQAFCLVHEQQCHVRQSRCMPAGMVQTNPVLMHCAGLPCIAYSKVGLRRQGADPSEMAVQVYLSERQQSPEDFFLFENVTLFPYEKIEAKLRDTHHLVPLSFGPKDLGFPCNRPRLFVLGIAKEKMVWIPPPNESDEAQRFFHMFGAEPTSYGNCYMTDSWSSMRSQLADRMLLRQLHLGAGALLEEPTDRTERFKCLCSAANPSSTSAAMAYEEMRQTRPLTEMGLPFFCDWEQNPASGKCTPSPFVPCLLTHGNLVEHTSARALTDAELFTVHGWGTLRNDRYRSDIMQVISSSAPRSAKQFLGNSMHIPSALAVLLYGFTHMLRLSDVNSRAWLITRRSASWSNEIGSTAAAALAESSAAGQSKGKGLSKGRGGRGRKRQAGEAEMAETDVAFRRAASTFFD